MEGIRTNIKWTHLFCAKEKEKKHKKVRKYYSADNKLFSSELDQGRRRRGAGGARAPPHFQKWGGTSGFVPPPHFWTEQMI